jgi:hypothetical protein
MGYVDDPSSMTINKRTGDLFMATEGTMGSPGVGIVRITPAGDMSNFAAGPRAGPSGLESQLALWNYGGGQYGCGRADGDVYAIAGSKLLLIQGNCRETQWQPCPAILLFESGVTKSSPAQLEINHDSLVSVKSQA